jgi:hypothetical protein
MVAIKLYDIETGHVETLARVPSAGWTTSAPAASAPTTWCTSSRWRDSAEPSFTDRPFHPAGLPPSVVTDGPARHRYAVRDLAVLRQTAQS